MKPVKLGRSPKGHRGDQDKVIAPADTVARARQRLAGQAEVELQRRAGIIDQAFAYASVGPALDTSGKGLTEDQARASAIMEFVERHAWLSFDYAAYPGYRVATHRELADAGLPVVEAEYFLHNFIEREEPEQLRAEITQIPLKWLPAQVLEPEPAAGEPRALWYPLSWHNLLFTSNGLASGNSLEEAVVQGLCELVERENVYRLFVERRPGRVVEPDSLTLPVLRDALAGAAAAGIEVQILEISSDLGVPTVIVRGIRAASAGSLTHVGVGQGAHPDPQKAVVRALAEYFEGLASLEAAEATSALNLGMFSGLLPKKHYGFHAFYNPEMLDAARERVTIDALPNLTADDFGDEARAILAGLAGQGIEVALIDKTHPEVGIPTVRLFAPRLRSCISTDFLGAPDLVLSGAYFEAGDAEAAGRHHGRALDRDPTWRMIKSFPLAAAILPSITQGMDPANVWGRDYLESLIRIGKTKKGGVALLADGSAFMGQLGGLLGGLAGGG